MSLLSFCQWLQHTQISTGIRESIWVFPIIETTHLMSLALSVGTIVWVDLRLIGATMRHRPVTEVIEPLQPWTVSGFAIMFLTGALLSLSEPLKCYQSAFFLTKLLFLLLLGLNAVIFHTTIYRSVATWNESVAVPFQAKLAGYVSIAFWMGVIVLGRGIAYTGH